MLHTVKNCTCILLVVICVWDSQKLKLCYLFYLSFWVELYLKRKLELWKTFLGFLLSLCLFLFLVHKLIFQIIFTWNIIYISLLLISFHISGILSFTLLCYGGFLLVEIHTYYEGLNLHILNILINCSLPEKPTSVLT